MKLDLDPSGSLGSLEKTCISATLKALDLNFIYQ